MMKRKRDHSELGMEELMNFKLQLRYGNTKEVVLPQLLGSWSQLMLTFCFNLLFSVQVYLRCLLLVHVVVTGCYRCSVTFCVLSNCPVTVPFFSRHFHSHSPTTKSSSTLDRLPKKTLRWHRLA